MPEPASSPPVQGDLMYSPPPPPHNLYWLSRRVLDMLGRLLVGVLICVLAVGLTILVSVIVYLLLGFTQMVIIPFH